MSADQVARQMWTMFEPVHAVTYFSAEARAAFEQAGLRGFWRGYFAGRAAPLGEVVAAPVAASFYTFSLPMVSRALPAVWQLITPEQALEVRQAGAVAALRRVLCGLGEVGRADGAGEPADPVSRAAGLLEAAAAGLDCSGRVLAAANAALPVPDEPVARLWHAATQLREHRGDGHFAALVAADVDGCEAVVLRSGLDARRETIQPLRGWTDDDWDAAAARLAGRGLLGDDGVATPHGAALCADVERATDAAAARPWADEELTSELARALYPIARACADELSFPNPVGVPAPAGSGPAEAVGEREAP